MIKHAVPLLHVSNSVAAETFYCQVLGFSKESVQRPSQGQDDPCYMALRRDGVWLHLSSFSGDGVSGSVVNFYVDDVDVLYEELVGKGAKPEMAPTDQSWGTREIYVKDADRNSLRFIEKAVRLVCAENLLMRR